MAPVMWGSSAGCGFWVGECLHLEAISVARVWCVGGDAVVKVWSREGFLFDVRRGLGQIERQKDANR